MKRTVEKTIEKTIEKELEHRGGRARCRVVSRAFLLLVILIGTLMSAVSLSCINQTQQTIRLGVVGPHSGDFASYGLTTLKEILRLAKQANEGGGRYTIEIIVVDDQCDSNQVDNASRDLIAEDVFAVIGHICSLNTERALEAYTEAGIPVISPASDKPILTEDQPLFFRTIAPYDAQGLAQVKFLTDVLKHKSVAIVYENQEYGKQIASTTKNALEAATVFVPIYEDSKENKKDLDEMVSRILASAVESVVFSGYPKQGAAIVSALRAQGFAGSFLASDGLFVQNFINLAGKAAEGTYVFSSQDRSRSTEYLNAAEGYRAFYEEEHQSFFREAHAAFQVIQQSIEEERGAFVTKERLLQKIKSSVFSTILGEISFNAQGEVEGTQHTVYRVQDNTFVLVQRL